MTLTPELRAYLQAGAFTRPQSEILQAIIEYLAGLTDAAYAPIDAQYVAIATDATLSSERVLTAGTGIDLADAGAGSTVTVSADLGDFDTGDLAEGSNLYFTEERVDDRVSSLLVAGTNVSLVYDDGANSLTVSATGAPGSASFVTLGLDATLTDERVLTAGTGINLTDAGAGSTVTVDVDLGDFDTGDLAEGTSLYFTDERA